MRGRLLLLMLFCLTGCEQSVSGITAESQLTPHSADAGVSNLARAREQFVTRIVRDDEVAGPADTPPAGILSMVKYDSAVGPLSAYVTPDPADGARRPAVIWITGGDCNTIGDVWSEASRDNDQSARAFREAGIVMMFPSLRGGNDNPGRREGFYGEVDDVLAAADYLKTLPYVDPDQLYLGGHSTGGTLVILAAEVTDRFAGVFSLGPVASPIQYGGSFLYCDPQNEQEVRLRSPLYWLEDVRTPLFVIEGAENGNMEAVTLLDQKTSNEQIQFFEVPGHDHFSVIAPVTELLAKRVVAGDLTLSIDDLRELQ